MSPQVGVVHALLQRGIDMNALDFVSMLAPCYVQSFLGT
jgi:hypothetical protein